ncbi:hypothetical protein AB751O23_AC_00050 [Chlamydiales bacterium SCGC AB-751-O23]|jgi:Skp family chaperone for outer membrane proteins|nr:hypothetical protein AB751O23_AC_00050 [Chlamydiales bacterium SCGC AB-751-O23]
MYKKIISSLFVLFMGLSLASFAFGGAAGKVGVIDLQACHEESALAKAEGKKLEDLKGKLKGGLEGKEKSFKEMKEKYDDQTFRDGLSDTARQEYEQTMNSTLKELEEYHNQLIRMLNQSGYEVAMNVLGSVEGAADKIAKEKQLDMVIRKELCLYYTPELDITKEIISEMDKSYGGELGQTESSTQTPAATATQTQTSKSTVQTPAKTTTAR